jgi:hypothetical protein
MMQLCSTVVYTGARVGGASTIQEVYLQEKPSQNVLLASCSNSKWVILRVCPRTQNCIDIRHLFVVLLMTMVW